MATTTPTTKTASTSTATSNVPSYQQAYNMSTDWLSRTVQAGQDTAGKQAATKDYYTAQDQARDYTYSQSAKSVSPLQDSMNYANSQLGNSRTVSSSSTKATAPANADQLKAMQQQADIDSASAAMQNLYKNADDSRQHGYDVDSQTRQYAHDTDSQTRQYGQESSMADKQNTFSAAESEKQRQLQAYLGNVDANSRMTSSLYSSLGSLNQNPYNYQYW